MLVHHGAERLKGRGFATAARRADLVITTYALATRDRETLATVKWERVALDEAQNIKTSDAKQTRAIRSLPARHRVALTGTPVENRLTELHSIMDFLNPGLLGPAATFKRCYATPIERWRDQRATDRLRQATGPFILRRLKTDKEHHQRPARQDRDAGRLPSDQGAGDALPGGRRRDAREGRARRRESSARGSSSRR